MNIVLVEPEIPQNTGNVARTCAALGATLHLVHPLGFRVDDRALRRAGLDYWHLLEVRHHASYDDFTAGVDPDDLVLFTSRAAVAYTGIEYSGAAYLVFGSESRGLPQEILRTHSGPTVRIPTVSDARCLNLSNAVAVAAYEAARQSGFAGLQTSRFLEGGLFD